MVDDLQGSLPFLSDAEPNLGQPADLGLKTPLLKHAMSSHHLCRAHRQYAQALDHFGEHRHDGFRGSGRCSRSTICGKICERHVGLMTDSGYDRNARSRNRADQNLFIETPEILERTAAPADDDDVRNI